MAQVHQLLAETYLQSESGSNPDGTYLARIHFYEAIELLEQTDPDDTAIEDIRQMMEAHGLT